MVITKEGNDKINVVWPDHVASVYKHFGQNLEREDAEALQTAAKKILAGEAVPTAVPRSPPPPG